MITFVMKKSEDGAPEVLCCGLSHENLKRLKEGQPIRIPGTRVDPNFPLKEVFIFAGETEDSMAAELEKHFSFHQKVDYRKPK